MAKLRINGISIEDVKLEEMDLNIDINLTVWLVDGEKVRDSLSIEFIGGGHNLVYDFIPENEIWIDNGTNEDEVKYYVLHEIYERGKMLEGLEYEEAHPLASNVECEARDNPKKFDDLLEKALKLNV